MSDTPENRCTHARKHAGLSVGQAALKLGVERTLIEFVEALHVDEFYEDTLAIAGRMADLYGVNLPWMLAQVDRYDYDALAALRAADSLVPRDRDVIAEILASRPKGPRCR